MPKNNSSFNFLIQNTIAFVQQELNDAEGGHDWFHVHRVYKNALLISENENVNKTIVALGALLHDIADSKFHNGDETIGPKKAKAFLQTQAVSQDTVTHIIKIIENVSFKGGNTLKTFHSKELEVLQDADRLDAIGAIGIARTFNYGGFKNRVIYNPLIKPKLEMTPQEYKTSDAPTINHFYEKLLKLKDKMNTSSGKKIAQERHVFMENFLEQFYQEWNGEK
tara:strand:- start:1343 stop:2011 length:669 start_codon:yes stop_codon:yes gene_type:complete